MIGFSIRVFVVFTDPLSDKHQAIFPAINAPVATSPAFYSG